MDPVASSYLSYKTDTNAISEWLFKFAVKHGFPLGRLESSPISTTSGPRLKGKARKKQKKKKKANTTRGPREWVELSQYIAEISNPPAVVPQIFFTVLERNI